MKGKEGYFGKEWNRYIYKTLIARLNSFITKGEIKIVDHDA